MLGERHLESIRLNQRLSSTISDLQFTSRYRVPFQYSRYVREHVVGSSFVSESKGVLLKDVDGNELYDLAGSYGVNVLGNDFYKECIDRGIDKVKSLGPVLGLYHPIIEDNVQKLKILSGLDEVSFHMSGTDAVMQAVRLARYHTRRSHVVCFCDAYHGWWDGVQAGIGNPRPARDIIYPQNISSKTWIGLR